MAKIHIEVLLCLLSCVSGGIMYDKMSPTKLHVKSDEAKIKAMSSAIIEHAMDLLDEMSTHIDSQKPSGKMGISVGKVFCSENVNVKFSHCTAQCNKLSTFESMLCNTQNFVKYFDACFSGNMECYTDSLITVGDCNSNCNCGTMNDPMEKIFGGKEVDYAVKFPWHVGIINTKMGKTAFCGGTIIGDKFVLTAAHCLHTQNIDENEFSVRIGDHIQTSTNDDIKDVTDTISVEKIYFHPENNKTSFENDIALLKLSQAITFKKEFGIRPICLPCQTHSYDYYKGKLALTLGWGKTKTDPNEIPTILKQAEVNILGRSCDNKATNNFDPDMHICSSSNLIKGFPCTADNGGSLVVNEGNQTHERLVLVGITLLGTCDETKPVIYTRVKPALNWIQSLNLMSTCLT